MKFRIALILLFQIACSETFVNKERSTMSYSIKDLSGDWVNIKYLNSVQKTKSAKISQESCEISYIEFKSDTALIIFNFHEGDVLILDSTSINTFIYKHYQYKAIFLIKNDTLFMTFGENYDTLVKYQMQISPNLYSNLLLNNEIFAGSYYIADSVQRTLTFTKDGKVEGFLNFKYYSVLEDYYDAGCNYDIIFLYNEITDRKEYTWSYDQGTLNIFELDCLVYDSIYRFCYDNKIGKLVCKLIKK
jgi:hypothetical protein